MLGEIGIDGGLQVSNRAEDAEADALQAPGSLGRVGPAGRERIKRSSGPEATVADCEKEEGIRRSESLVRLNRLRTSNKLKYD